MIGNQPPHRTGSSRSPARLFPDDRERSKRARQAAEALFAPKPPETDTPAVDRPVSQSRVLETPAPASPKIINADPPKIPASRVARIRACVRYGMTIGQVAQLYRVSIAEIERLLKAEHADPHTTLQPAQAK